MTRPLILFPDPVELTIGALRVALSDVDGLTVSASTPERTPETTDPAILVADDGDAGGGSRVTEHATVRLTVWASDLYTAMSLARQARAHLIAHLGGSGSAGYFGGTRPNATTDPDDGSPMATFVITARLRPE